MVDIRSGFNVIQLKLTWTSYSRNNHHQPFVGLTLLLFGALIDHLLGIILHIIAVIRRTSDNGMDSEAYSSYQLMNYSYRVRSF
jgi:hypothetical protein